MKLKALLFAVCAILIAFGAAYATKSQNEIRTVPVFYIDNNGDCVAGTVQSTLCDITETADCQEVILEIGGAPRQIYNAFLSQKVCDEPYDRPDAR